MSKIDILNYVTGGILREDDNPNILTLNLDSGLRIWRSTLAKLDSGSTGIYNVVCLGDSITEGANATDYISQGYVGLLRSKLASLYGEVGSGVIPIYYPHNSPILTASSGWNKYNGSVWGIMSTVYEASATGQTLSGSFTGTGITLYVVGGRVTGKINVNIDSAGDVLYDTHSTSTNTMMPIVITGLGQDTHTIVITSDCTNGVVYFIGMLPTNATATGIRVHNVARYGAMSSAAVISTDNLKAEIDTWSPVLTTIAFGANDFTGNTPISTFTTNIQTQITRAKTFGDVLIIANGLRSDSGTYPQSSYTSALKSLAVLNNCAFIDINTRWNNDWNYVLNTLGLADSGQTVHPNIAGQQDIANALIDILIGH